MLTRDMYDVRDDELERSRTSQVVSRSDSSDSSPSPQPKRPTSIGCSATEAGSIKPLGSGRR